MASCVVSQKFKIISHNKSLNDTMAVYRDALNYIVDVCFEYEALIETRHSTKKKYNFIERLIHTTKRHKAVCDFDTRFYKFPSYFRRTATAEAYGMYSSYVSNLANWRASGSHKAKPGRPVAKKCFPTFYKGNMFKKVYDSTVWLKVFRDGDWKYETVTLKMKPTKHNKHHWDGLGLKENNPILLKQNGVYYLSYSYEKSQKLNTVPLKEQIAVGVDLGLNNDAVCSAIDSGGTVMDRKFIKLSREKDLLKRMINKIKRNQQNSGLRTENTNYWRKVNNLQSEIVNQTCGSILRFALKNEASVIVMEYLSENFHSRGSVRNRIHMWNKRRIQRKLEEMAHMHGIRIRRVNPAYSSKLAFDGSGEVHRHEENHSLCTFTTGKVYHTDLSASYNIGARYFIKEHIKTSSANKKSLALAKVPGVEKSSTCTLATLITLISVL